MTPEKRSDKILIDKYLTQELTAQERQEWNKKIQEKDFQETVEWYQTTVDNMATQYQNSPLKIEFKAAAARYQRSENKEKPTRSFIRLLSAHPGKVAAVLLIAASILIMSWANLQYSSEAIAQSLEVPLLNDTPQGAVNPDVNFQWAKSKFYAEDYQGATPLLASIPTDHPKHAEAQVLLAYSMYYLRDYEKAIEYFDTIINDSALFGALSSHYKSLDKLRWSRLLCYVSKEETESVFFKNELNYFLAESSSFYREKSQLLQDKLASPLRKVVIF